MNNARGINYSYDPFIDAIVLKKPGGASFSFEIFDSLLGPVKRMVRERTREQLKELIAWLDEPPTDWDRLLSVISPSGPSHAQTPQEEDVPYTHLSA